MLSSLNATAFQFVALAVGTSYFLTAVAKVVARRTGLLDRPDGRRKSQQLPVPLLGGAAIFLSFLITVGLGYSEGWHWLTQRLETSRLTLTLLVSGGLFCLVGLWDDSRSMRPRTKLLLQIVASLPFVIWGQNIATVHILGNAVELGVLGAVFTTFWLVACANVINLVDGLDGLAGTIGLIVCLAVAALSSMQGTAGPTALALVFSGCLLGFLLHNWPPASIYLGDSGSLTIGFIIGALSIESSMKTATGFALTVPLVLISVPVFDTFMAIVRRKLSGKGIGEADRGHIHHCLQNRGLTRYQSLLAISGLCVVMAAVTLVSAYFQNDVLALALCASLLVMVIAGRVFGYDETQLFFRYVQAMSMLLAETSGVLRTRLLMDRMTRDAGDESIDYWNEVTQRVAEMGAVQLEFVCWKEPTDEVVCRLRWTNESQATAGDRIWQFDYSVPGDDGVRATLVCSGQSSENLKGQRLVDLFRVFDTFCQNWPSVAASVKVGELTTPVIAMPLPRPRLLPQSAAKQESPIEERRVA